jgi:hypothetical protein
VSILPLPPAVCRLEKQCILRRFCLTAQKPARLIHPQNTMPRLSDDVRVRRQWSGKRLCNARRDYGARARPQVLGKRAERLLMDAQAGLTPAGAPAKVSAEAPARLSAAQFAAASGARVSTAAAPTGDAPAASSHDVAQSLQPGNSVSQHASAFAAAGAAGAQQPGALRLPALPSAPACPAAQAGVTTASSAVHAAAASHAPAAQALRLPAVPASAPQLAQPRIPAPAGTPLRSFPTEEEQQQQQHSSDAQGGQHAGVGSGGRTAHASAAAAPQQTPEGHGALDGASLPGVLASEALTDSDPILSGSPQRDSASALAADAAPHAADAAHLLEQRAAPGDTSRGVGTKAAGGTDAAAIGESAHQPSPADMVPIFHRGTGIASAIQLKHEAADAAAAAQTHSLDLPLSAAGIAAGVWPLLVPEKDTAAAGGSSPKEAQRLRDSATLSDGALVGFSQEGGASQASQRRIVLHVDVDCFYCQVRLRNRGRHAVPSSLFALCSFQGVFGYSAAIHSCASLPMHSRSACTCVHLAPRQAAAQNMQECCCRSSRRTIPRCAAARSRSSSSTRAALSR